jgi:hypothetical protein
MQHLDRGGGGVGHPAAVLAAGQRDRKRQTRPKAGAAGEERVAQGRGKPRRAILGLDAPYCGLKSPFDSLASVNGNLHLKKRPKI